MDEHLTDHDHGDEACAICGSPVDALERHVRFDLPNAVLDLPEQERTAGT